MAQIPELLSDLVLPGMAVAACPLDDPAPAPWGAEARCLARARPARRHEFALGRHCARKAMLALNFPPSAIPAGADRAPIWPAGTVGSISHGAGWCAALVARAATVASVGIDIEAMGALDGEVAALVLREEERDLVGRLGGGDGLHWPSVCFSLKEAAYKAFYPLHRRIVDFHQVRIDPGAGPGRFAARLLPDPGGSVGGLRAQGRFATCAGRTLAVAWIARPEAAGTAAAAR